MNVHTSERRMRGVLGLLILHTPLVKLNIKMKVSGECVRVCACVCICAREAADEEGQRRRAMPNPVGCEGISLRMEMRCRDVLSGAWITKPS